MTGTDKGTGYNQCFRMGITEGDSIEKIAVQSLCEEEDAPLTFVYYPVMERGQDITVHVTGCPYEGEKRGMACFYNQIEIGYFEK